MKGERLSFRLIKLIIWLIIIFGIYFYASYSGFKSQILTQKDIVVQIPSGTTFKTLSKVLADNKIEINDFYFDFYTKMGNVKTDLQAGYFKIPAGSNISDLLFSLEKPYINTMNVTLLEGWNIFDIDSYLTSKNLINKGDFIEIAENYEPKGYDFLMKGNSLEGFLYPDTYEIKIEGFSSKNLIDKMLNNFERKIGDSLKNLNKQKIYDLIKMASIVEKEEKTEKNRPIVAGILYSRIENNDAIGADITVCYPYEMTNKECNPNFIAKHIRDINDYNTRTMKGLPKTPIGNPTVSSIIASLNPKETDYYFYLHDNNGQIHYAKTNAEHEANKRKYL